MEYLFYIFAVLIIGLLCFVSIRLSVGNSSRQIPLSQAEKRRAMPTAMMLDGKLVGKKHLSHKVPAKSVVLKREVRSVPTPWGWPNHLAFNGSQTRHTSLTDAMLSFTDRLVREKQLVDTRSNNPRTNGSVRALLEDRYGRINKDSMDSIDYQLVKSPLLRDPSEPHDQMDNFGSKEAERIRAKFKRVVAMQSSPAITPKSDELRYVEIKDVKQPWGW